MIHAVYAWIMDQGFLWIIFSAIQLENNAGFSPQCYSQLNCETGSEIETPADTPTAKDCCVGTNEGQSYADSGGNCIVPQCLGERSFYFFKHTKSTKKSWHVSTMYNYRSLGVAWKPPRAQKGWGQAHCEVVQREPLEPDRFSSV